MSQYDFKFNRDERRINEVVNKEYGPVVFDGQIIDQQATYVLNSRVTVYTTILQMPFGNDTAEILNIIHVHLSDMSDFTSIDTVYLKKGETRENHMEFGVDEMGTVLRYKLLVKNLAVHEILYNTGSSVEVVPFDEVRFELGAKYVVRGVNDLSEMPLFATVKSIPVQMLCCSEQYRAFANTLEESKADYFMFGHCQRRCFERLPGYIDLEVWSMDGLQTLNEEPFLVAVPACKLELPDDLSLMLYESHMSSRAEAKKSGLSNALEAMEQLVAKQDNPEERKAIEANLETLNEYFSSLQKAESDLETATNENQDQVSEETSERRENVAQKANQIKRRLAAAIRFEQRKVH